MKNLKIKIPEKEKHELLFKKKNHNGTHIIMLSPIKHPVLQIENKTVKNE